MTDPEPRPKIVIHYVAREGSVEADVYDALRAKMATAAGILEHYLVARPGETRAALGHRDGASSCPFHPDRAQVSNGMCGPCAEKYDDAL